MSRMIYEFTAQITCHYRVAAACEETAQQAARTLDAEGWAHFADKTQVSNIQLIETRPPRYTDLEADAHHVFDGNPWED